MCYNINVMLNALRLTRHITKIIQVYSADAADVVRLGCISEHFGVCFLKLSLCCLYNILLLAIADW